MVQQLSRQEVSDRLVALYKSGETSLVALANKVGHKPTMVLRLLRERGIEPDAIYTRKIEGERRRHLVQQVARRYTSGETSIPELARKVGCKPDIIVRILRDGGIIVPGTDQTASDLMRRYEQGETMRALSREMYTSMAKMRKLLVDAGAEIRPFRTRPTGKDVERLAERYLAGESLASLAKDAEWGQTSIRAGLIDYGVTLRPRSGSSRTSL